jgi:hypothetical protein
LDVSRLGALPDDGELDEFVERGFVLYGGQSDALAGGVHRLPLRHGLMFRKQSFPIALAGPSKSGIYLSKSVEIHCCTQRCR